MTEPILLSRSRHATALALLLPILVVAARPVDAPAAFEWPHRGARSWVIGIHAASWPAPDWVRHEARSAIHGSARRARPWGWPGLRAVAMDCGWRQRSWRVDLALAQLGVADYRESRWTALVGTRVARDHWVAAAWSALAVRSPGAARNGHELTLGWRVTRSGWYAGVKGQGVWRSDGARLLRPPRDFVVLLGRRAAGATFEALWREGDVGNQGRLGAAIAIGTCCEVRAALASEVPHLRWGVGVEVRGLRCDLAWLWHDDLPHTQVIEISWEMARR